VRKYPAGGFWKTRPAEAGFEQYWKLDTLEFETVELGNNSNS